MCVVKGVELTTSQLDERIKTVELLTEKAGLSRPKCFMQTNTGLMNMKSMEYKFYAHIKKRVC